jgi:hypothetical protein
LYAVIVKFLNIFKSESNEKVEIDEEFSVKINKDTQVEKNNELLNKEVYDFPFSDTKIETEKTNDFENNRENFGDSKEIESVESVEKSIFNNQYFWFTISIISLSLIYYYWDNISDLFSKITKPGDDTDPNIIPDIEIEDKINWSKKFNGVTKNCDEIISDLKKLTRTYLDNQDKFSMETLRAYKFNIMGNCETLKVDYNKAVEIYNDVIGQSNLNEIHRIRMLKHLDAIKIKFNEFKNVIPNYDLIFQDGLKELKNLDQHLSLNVENLGEKEVPVIYTPSEKLPSATGVLDNLPSSSKFEETSKSFSTSPTESIASDKTVRSPFTKGF